ncbi:MAG: prolyl oligopeptidase family serine peptidase [Salinivirgaceae bacterium]|nr:prolyl oligopeptidase family serine peptidase [Salinivirgaceae bacterium]
MKKFPFLLLFFIFPYGAFAQEDLAYQKPSAEILALADYERAPSISMDTKKEYMLLRYQDTYKTLDELNIEEMRLGGLRINPITNISSTLTYVNNLKIRKISDTKREPIQVANLPENPKIANISWSPNDTKIAFTHTAETGVELWVIDVATAKAKKLTDATLNSNLGSPFRWTKDNETLLVKMIPADRKPLIDQSKSLPTGPIISVAEGQESQNRTYQDLLSNKTDEINFETLIASELYKINLNGDKKLFMGKELYYYQSISPNGEYLSIATFHKPFSYIVPYYRFPITTTVYTMEGEKVKVVNEEPLVEIMAKGFNATREGKRNMSWRDDKPASLYFVEALDGGDPAKEVEYRDELYSWDAPFTNAPVSLMKTKQRFYTVLWGNETTALVYDQWYNTRNMKTYLLNPSDLKNEPTIIYDRNYQDVYSNPGSFETRENEFGADVLAIENGNLFLIGSGYTEKGQFPFIDQFNLKTLKTKRLYQSTFTDKKESIFSIVDYKKGTALVMIQSKNEYPNYYFRSFYKKDKIDQITFTKNPFESIKDVHKEVIKYKRADGVELSGTLYLPLGYDTKNPEKLPLLIWAYPQEYKDKNSAGQSTQNPNEFTFPYYGSFVFWVTKGYVVLDDASFPIIGEGENEPNDTFIEQLVANGKAAIDAVDKLGYIDRTKVAIGGHSYGAFMTANLLSHSNDYACGIARSGAYNRTLTPFGFQMEQRNFWDVPAVYGGMSPFFSANKMKTPILLVHGEADNNPGTFTLQTERYFQAIKGLGGNARMVILPKESHGYQAKKNILHLLWEQEQFLDKYLKGK